MTCQHPATAESLGVVADVLSSWLDTYPGPSAEADRAAWHPYCLSRRIAVWCRLLRTTFAESSEDTTVRTLRPRLMGSLAEQARTLTGRLERDLGGNHLWENARALALVGEFFDGPEADRWRRLGLSLLERCVAEQVAETGEHFERAPMYQAELAEGLSEVAETLADLEPAAAERLAAVAARMTRFLDAIRHPDGTVPLLGDTTLDHPACRASRPPSPRSDWAGLDAGPTSGLDAGLTSENVVRAAQAVDEGLRVEEIGDYWIVDAGPRGPDGRGLHRLIIDAGDMGPDHLPAHAHADLLGFEMSRFGHRLITDAGVYQYQGAERNRYRRSSAHNVLTVDGHELADVWGEFRMGRRGHVVRRSMTWLAAADLDELARNVLLDERASRPDPSRRWRSASEVGPASKPAPDSSTADFGHGSSNAEHDFPAHRVAVLRASHDAYGFLGVEVERIWVLAGAEGPWWSIHVVRGRDGRSRRLEERIHCHPDVTVEPVPVSGPLASIRAEHPPAEREGCSGEDLPAPVSSVGTSEPVSRRSPPPLRGRVRWGVGQPMASSENPHAVPFQGGAGFQACPSVPSGGSRPPLSGKADSADGSWTESLASTTDLFIVRPPGWRVIEEVTSCSEYWNEARPKRSLVVTGEASLPAFSAWLVADADTVRSPSAEIDGDVLRLRWRDRHAARELLVPLATSGEPSRARRRR
jgi:hypothetical protein